MAQHISLKLPALKLRKRDTSGSCQRQDIYPVSSATSASEIQDEDNDPELYLDAGTSDDTEGPSLYKIQQESSVAEWNEIRDKLVRAVVETNAMPLEQICVKCLESPASLRCQKCSVASFYCESCFVNEHSNANFFHVPEEWKV